jgi:hypothetical protein
MTVAFNHTIVHAHDPEASAASLAEILGVGAPTHFGPFACVQLDNGVTLDFIAADGDVVPNHYAFLVDEAGFDRVLGRIRQRGLPTWADPGRREPDRINHHDGGRGVYWSDADGHYLEIITRPYGGG